MIGQDVYFAQIWNSIFFFILLFWRSHHLKTAINDDDSDRESYKRRREENYVEIQNTNLVLDNYNESYHSNYSNFKRRKKNYSIKWHIQNIVLD